MTVKQSTATVYFGGRRRWLSLAAACRAEAKLRYKTDEESDERFEVRVPQLEKIVRAEFDASAPAAPTAESRALDACRALVATRAEVERLSSAIGDSLSACHLDWMREQEKKGDMWGNYESHLKAAYEPEYNDEDDAYYRDEAAIQTMLGTCPHCLSAHNTIQERKVAKRRLAAARRAITMIGRIAP